MNTQTSRDWANGPMWLRQRSLGKNKPQRMQASHDLVRRLGLEAPLSLRDMTWYTQSYFPLDWNQKGTLLAIARADPRHLLTVWDVFKQREECTVETGYSWSYDKEAVKFMPFSDTQLALCCPTGGLRLVDTVKNESSLVCNRYGITDIAVHPSEPNLIWSVICLASEDVTIICCDTRQARECASYKYEAATRIAINPLHGEILALGYSVGDVRLLDRRALRSGASPPCIAFFEPVNPNVHRYLGLIGLAFNSDGSELLVSIHGEDIYLLTTHEPWEKYRRFDLSIKPLLSDEAELIDQSTSSKLRPNSYLKELQKQCPVKMQDELKVLCDDILSRNSTFTGPSNIIDHINRSLEEGSGPNQQAPSLRDENIIDYLNVLLAKLKNCPDLYRARAIALMRRAHRGDYYQALRDCCCALVLKPLDFRTIRCLSSTLIKLDNKEDVCRLLDFVNDAMKEFGDHDDLTKSREMLLAFKEMKENESITDVERTDSIHSYTVSGYSESAPSESAHSESARSESTHSESTSSESTNSGSAQSHYAYAQSALSESPHVMEPDSESTTRIFDYSHRYHSTVKNFRCYGVNFFGSRDEFIIGGGETAFHVWDKNTTNVVKTVEGTDGRIVLPHPSICMVATSGSCDTVKLWSPIGEGN